MARFRGSVQGIRGQATRLGGKDSGLTCTCNGSGAGVWVDARVDNDGADVFEVYATNGSANGSIGSRGRLMVVITDSGKVNESPVIEYHTITRREVQP